MIAKTYDQYATYNPSKLSDEERFVSISQREDRGEYDSAVWRRLAADNVDGVSWRGCVLNKSPIEIALYPMLIEELKPKTIFELGALNGGGALWMTDIANIMGLSPTMISVDMDLKMLSPHVAKDSRIEFIEGDANAIETVFPASRLAELPHPWLIIEDCHVNTLGILDHFYNNGLSAGDYMIVEDTNQTLWDCWAQDWDSEAETCGQLKLDDLRAWCAKHPDMAVDTKYLDAFGYNASKNWNSVLVKRP